MPESIASRAKSITTSSTTAGNRTRVTISDGANSIAQSTGGHNEEDPWATFQNPLPRRDGPRPFSPAQFQNRGDRNAPEATNVSEGRGQPPLIYGSVNETLSRPLSFAPSSIPTGNPFETPALPTSYPWDYPPGLQHRQREHTLPAWPRAAVSPPSNPRPQYQYRVQNHSSRNPPYSNYAEPGGLATSRAEPLPPPRPPLGPLREQSGVPFESTEPRTRRNSSFRGPTSPLNRQSDSEQPSYAPSRPDVLIPRPPYRLPYEPLRNPVSSSNNAVVSSALAGSRAWSTHPRGLIEYQPNLGEPREPSKSVKPPRVYYETDNESESDSELRGRHRTLRRSSARRERSPRHSHRSAISDIYLSASLSSHGAASADDTISLDRSSDSDNSWERTSSRINPSDSASRQEGTGREYVIYNNLSRHSGTRRSGPHQNPTRKSPFANSTSPSLDSLTSSEGYPESGDRRRQEWRRIRRSSSGSAESNPNLGRYPSPPVKVDSYRNREQPDHGQRSRHTPDRAGVRTGPQFSDTTAFPAQSYSHDPYPRVGHQAPQPGSTGPPPSSTAYHNNGTYDTQPRHGRYRGQRDEYDFDRSHSAADPYAYGVESYAGYHDPRGYADPGFYPSPYGPYGFPTTYDPIGYPAPNAAWYQDNAFHNQYIHHGASGYQNLQPDPFGRQPAGNPFEPFPGLLDESMRHSAYTYRDMKSDTFSRKASKHQSDAGPKFDNSGGPSNRPHVSNAPESTGSGRPVASPTRGASGSRSLSTSSASQAERAAKRPDRRSSTRELLSNDPTHRSLPDEPPEADQRPASESESEAMPERHVRWAPSDTEVDSQHADDLLDAFDVSIFSVRKVESSESDTTSANDDTLESRAMPFQGSWHQHSIKRSLWLGNSLDGRNLTADMTVFAKSPPASKPIFTWTHLTRDIMNFEEFMAVAQQHSKLTSRDGDNIRDFLRKIHHDNQKPRQFGCDMEPTCLSEFDYETVGQQRKPLSSVVFYSMPFISLEKYNGASLRLLPQGSAAHPVRGIVQAFTRVSNDKRELNQAVTTRSSTMRGHCLHTASMWCLIINEHVLITCSRLNLKDLQGSAVNMIEPPYDTEPNDVRIMAGASCGWQVPTENVHAWPNLLAFFGDHLSDAISSRHGFRHEGKKVSGSSWPSVMDRSTIQHVELEGIQNAEKGGRDIVGTFAIAQAVVAQTYPDCAGLKTVSGPDSKGSKPGSASGVTANQPGHIDHLSDLPASREMSTLGLFVHANHSQGRTLKGMAELMHKTLSSTGNKEERIAYFKCPRANVRKISDWLSRANDKASPRLASETWAFQNRRREAQQIAILVIYMCAFFWPPNCEELVVEKLLGAALKLLESTEASPASQETHESSGVLGRAHKPASARHRSSDQTSELLAILRDEILPHLHRLTAIFAGSEHCLQFLPVELFRAWLRLVRSFAQVAKDLSVDEAQLAITSDLRTRPLSKAIHQLKLMSDDMKNGERELASMLREKDSLAHEICTTRGVAVLLADRLCDGVMGSTPEVVQIYDDYYQQMQSVVRRDRFERIHQDTIGDFKQELDAVLAIMQNQLKVLDLLGEGNKKLSDDDKFPDILAFRGDRPLVKKMHEALKKAEYRIDALQSLSGRAGELETWHMSQIETNKDRQEAAIIVFTMVTTIFLPLSFVASVLGMNTNDIRNMDSNQWVFWADAVPLSVLVMIMSLWSAGHIDEPRIWLAALIRPRNNKRSAAFPDGPGKLDRVSSKKADTMDFGGALRRRTTYLAVPPRKSSLGA